ncbi:MAG: DUF4242 domain-containing protein [Paracoccaceae bacterium]|nr:DUF4242 domain-containing protein [Paracoccaceae bacterium]
MQLYMIRRSSAWADQAELERIAAVSARVGNEDMPDKVRWIRSYVVNEPDGRLGSCCIYEAVDAEALREHARCVGMPADEVLPIGATAVIRPDPG